MHAEVLRSFLRIQPFLSLLRRVQSNAPNNGRGQPLCNPVDEGIDYPIEVTLPYVDRLGFPRSALNTGLQVKQLS